MKVSKSLSTAPLVEPLGNMDIGDLAQRARVFNQAVKQFVAFNRMGFDVLENPALNFVIGSGQELDDLLKLLWPDDYDPEKVDEEAGPMAAMLGAMFSGVGPSA